MHLRDFRPTTGHGATLTDGQRTVLDLSGFRFGYQHPAVVEAVADQFTRGGLSSRALMSRPMLALTERLATLTPGPLTMSYLCNSPSEAFEGAMKLVRGYAPRRTRLVVVDGGDFGTLTYGRALGAPVDGPTWPLGLEIDRVRPDQLDRLAETVSRETAAIVVNPLLQRPRLRLLTAREAGHLNRARDRSGALLAVAEHQTFGRVPRAFVSGDLGLDADVLVYGDALGGGVLPIGAYTARRRVNERVYGRRNLALHGSTTGGNPASCVAALAALDALTERTAAAVCRAYDDAQRDRRAALEAGAAAWRAHLAFGPACLQLTMTDAAAAERVAERCHDADLLVRVEAERVRVSAPLMMPATDWARALTRLATLLADSAPDDAAVHNREKDHAPTLRAV